MLNVVTVYQQYLDNQITWSEYICQLQYIFIKRSKSIDARSKSVNNKVKSH